MDELRRQYFAVIPAKSMKWKDFVKDWSDFSTESQISMLSHTVLDEFSVTFPLSVIYQRSFLKYVIKQIETQDLEVADELYEIYTHLMSQANDVDSGYCHKTYFLRADLNISLLENRSFISQGTTGLYTWQAAQYLSEYVVAHADELKNRHVLELGSGLGLLGLVTLKTCQPVTFTYSDCHMAVLQLLARNVELNMSDNPSRGTPDPCLKRQIERFKNSSSNLRKSVESLSNVLDKGSWKTVGDTHWTLVEHPSVCVRQLDWERTTNNELIKMFGNTEIILASDVVFDDRIIPALVRVLGCLLKNGARAYIASTVRNTATRDTFLHALDEENMKYELIQEEPAPLFYYDRSVPIELLLVTR